ncbi:uncharacterized protein BcabD6B2_04430 [Babesia caballi]|uniref:Uncharacterized protein n=1 Tax=Babesia caballi TaxID=5871 RepID=A0AAV4LMR7_BABCB|nr:hypothetical protein BcabD6B2_04430 [Babesia caballi]
MQPGHLLQNAGGDLTQGAGGALVAVAAHVADERVHRTSGVRALALRRLNLVLHVTGVVHLSPTLLALGEMAHAKADAAASVNGGHMHPHQELAHEDVAVGQVGDVAHRGGGAEAEPVQPGAERVDGHVAVAAPRDVPPGDAADGANSLPAPPREALQRPRLQGGVVAAVGLRHQHDQAKDVRPLVHVAPLQRPAAPAADAAEQAAAAEGRLPLAAHGPALVLAAAAEVVARLDLLPGAPDAVAVAVRRHVAPRARVDGVQAADLGGSLDRVIQHGQLHVRVSRVAQLERGPPQQLALERSEHHELLQLHALQRGVPLAALQQLAPHPQYLAVAAHRVHGDVQLAQVVLQAVLGDAAQQVHLLDAAGAGGVEADGGIGVVVEHVEEPLVYPENEHAGSTPSVHEDVNPRVLALVVGEHGRAGLAARDLQLAVNLGFQQLQQLQNAPTAVEDLLERHFAHVPSLQKVVAGQHVAFEARVLGDALLARGGVQVLQQPVRGGPVGNRAEDVELLPHHPLAAELGADALESGLGLRRLHLDDGGLVSRRHSVGRDVKLDGVVVRLLEGDDMSSSGCRLLATF